MSPELNEFTIVGTDRNIIYYFNIGHFYLTTERGLLVDRIEKFWLSCN